MTGRAVSETNAAGGTVAERERAITPRDEHGRADAAWASVPVIAAIVAGCALAFSRDFYIGFFLPDDAYYYLRIAENAASGAGLSFDGVHLTNGFQFLWQMMLIPCAFVAHRLGADLVALAALLQGLLIGFACAVGMKAARMSGASAPASAIGFMLVLANPLVSKPLFSGMEAAVLFAALAVWAHECVRYATRAEDRSASTADAVRLGAASAAVFLARMDAAVLLPATLLPLVRTRGAGEPVRAAGRWAAIVAATVAAWALWNQAVFGLPIPVSAAVKRWVVGQAQPSLVSRLLSEEGVPAMLVRAVVRLGSVVTPTVAVLSGLVLVALLVLLVRTAAASPQARRSVSAWAFLAVGVMLHLLYLATFVGRYAFIFWYYVPEMLLLAVCAIGAVDGLMRVRPPLLARTALAVTLAGAAAAYGLVYARYTFDPARKTRFVKVVEVGRWVDEHLPPGARIASWNAGAVAYFSRRQVVNLDGLVNDARYFREYLTKGRLVDYLDDEGVEYLVDYVSDPNAWRELGVAYEVVAVFPYEIDETSAFEAKEGVSREQFVVARLVSRPVSP